MPKSTLKIAAYNIACGGFEDYSYEHKTPERLNLIKKAVDAINADFIALIDTFRWDEEFTNEELREMFNFKFAHSINLQDERLIELGHNNGITVLTDLPVLESQEVFIHSRNCIRTVVELNGNKLQIFSTYLDDLSEDTRLKQVEELLKNTEDEVSTIIMGDLNTIDPKHKDKSSKKIQNLFQKYPDLKSKIGKAMKGMQKGGAIEKLKKNGFHSASTKFSPTLPTPLYKGLNYPKPIAALDHIFVKGDVEVKNVEVPKSNLFKKASDHYPIVAEVAS